MKWKSWSQFRKISNVCKVIHIEFLPQNSSTNVRCAMSATCNSPVFPEGQVTPGAFLMRGCTRKGTEFIYISCCCFLTRDTDSPRCWAINCQGKPSLFHDVVLANVMWEQAPSAGVLSLLVFVSLGIKWKGENVLTTPGSRNASAQMCFRHCPEGESLRRPNC